VLAEHGILLFKLIIVLLELPEFSFSVPVMLEKLFSEDGDVVRCGCGVAGRRGGWGRGHGRRRSPLTTHVRHFHKWRGIDWSLPFNELFEARVR